MPWAAGTDPNRFLSTDGSRRTRSMRHPAGSPSSMSARPEIPSLASSQRTPPAGSCSPQITTAGRWRPTASGTAGRSESGQRSPGTPVRDRCLPGRTRRTRTASTSTAPAGSPSSPTWGSTRCSFSASTPRRAASRPTIRRSRGCPRDRARGTSRSIRPGNSPTR